MIKMTLLFRDIPRFYTADMSSSPWQISFVSPSQQDDTRIMLDHLQKKLLQCVANKDKVTTEDVQRSWSAWEASIIKNHVECEKKIENYLKHFKGPRDSHSEAYKSFQQFVKEKQQTYDLASKSEKETLLNQYLSSTIKPKDILMKTSDIYTIYP